MPNQPIGYYLDGDRNGLSTVTYTKNQLQVVSNKEQAPPSSVIRGTPSKYIIKEIVDKRKKGKKIEYRVRWKGYTESDDTWEPRDTLIKDAPDVVEQYESLAR